MVMLETITWDDFLKIINNDSGQKILFIPVIETSQNITKPAIGLANQKGGILVLGYDNNNLQLRGVSFDAKWLNAVLYNEIRPILIYTIKSATRNKKRIFIINIPEGKEKPYTVQGISTIDVQIKEVNQEEIEEVFTPTLISKREQRCLDYLKTNHIVTNAKYREINAVSHKTAHNELSELIKRGLIRQVGQGRTTSYVLMDSEITEATSPSVQINGVSDQNNLFGHTIDVLINSENNNKDALSKTKLRSEAEIDHMAAHYSEVESEFSNITEEQQIP
jgi:predicted HTH transcriptional regulator